MSESRNTGMAAKLARPNILELQPYRCARDDYSTGILLDANENALGPAITANDNYNNNINIQLERYPDPYQIPLKTQLLAHRRGHDLQPANIFVGVGSDEAIDLLMRIFCTPGRDTIITTPPTYGMYKVCAKVNDVQIVQVPLTPEFNVVVSEIINAITPEVKLIFLCSPGNPTAKAIPLNDITQIADQATNAIVVVDEAYVDFSSYGTALSLVNQYNNIVVLQTLSKAFGLAAIRCGFCFGPPDIVQLLNNVKAPYNVNSLTSQQAISALQISTLEQLQRNIDTLLEQRQYLVNVLENDIAFVTKVYPSDANFILFRLDKNAQQVYKKMADSENVVTRYRGTELHCDECIRVTVGTPEENQAFLKALQKVYKELE